MKNLKRNILLATTFLVGLGVTDANAQRLNEKKFACPAKMSKKVLDQADKNKFSYARYDLASGTAKRDDSKGNNLTIKSTNVEKSSKAKRFGKALKRAAKGDEMVPLKDQSHKTVSNYSKMTACYYGNKSYFVTVDDSLFRQLDSTSPEYRIPRPSQPQIASAAASAASIGAGSAAAAGSARKEFRGAAKAAADSAGARSAAKQYSAGAGDASYKFRTSRADVRDARAEVRDAEEDAVRAMSIQENLGMILKDLDKGNLAGAKGHTEKALETADEMVSDELDDVMEERTEAEMAPSNDSDAQEEVRDTEEDAIAAMSLEQALEGILGDVNAGNTIGAMQKAQKAEKMAGDIVRDEVNDVQEERDELKEEKMKKLMEMREKYAKKRAERKKREMSQETKEDDLTEEEQRIRDSSLGDLFDRKGIGAL